MSVTVDQQPLPADELGLKTVGQVLAHVQSRDRLVVQLLIDGQEPDMRRLGSLKQAPLLGHTLYIETAEPKALALEALAEVETQLEDADRFKAEAVRLLQANDAPKAMEKLSRCFSAWQGAQESVTKTAQLLRIDLSRIEVSGRSLIDVLGEFSSQLRSIRASLEDRDFVRLCDTLEYETTETSRLWHQAIGAMRAVIA